MNPEPLPQKNVEDEDSPMSEELRIRVALNDPSLDLTPEKIEATREDEDDAEDEEIWEMNKALEAGIPIENVLAGEKAPRKSVLRPVAHVEEAVIQPSAKPLGNNFVHRNKLNTLVYVRSPNGFIPVAASVDYSDIGFEQANQITSQKLEQSARRESQKAAAGSLVRRARQGDQNAMGMIAAIRDSASKGNPDAQSTFGFLQEYVQENPVSEFGEEVVPSNRLDWQIGMLCQGAPLTDSYLNEMVASLSPTEQRAFKSAFKMRNVKFADTLFAGEFERSAFEMGQAFAQARRIQEVRLPNSRISKFHPVAGWELGE